MPLPVAFDTRLPDEPSAVGYFYSLGRGLFHVGLLYKTAADPVPRLLDLAFHCRLRNTLLDEASYPADVDFNRYWSNISIDPINMTVLAGRCAGIASANGNGNVPYGIVWNREDIYFDTAGQYIPGQPGRGLTCATFVLAIFESIRLPVLKTDPWQARRGDIAWQEYIIAEVEQNGANPDHIAALRNDIGCARYQPSDVVAGCISDQMPIGQLVAIERGREVIELLEANNH